MKKVVVFAFLFSLKYIALAQTYDIQYIGRNSGLFDLQITSIEQDELGYIWIGTLYGELYRFDGINMIDFYKNQPSRDKHNINQIIKVSNGELWVCSDGITVINPLTLSQKTFFSGKQIGNNPNVKNTFYSLLKDERTGIIWGSCEKGIFKILNEDLNNLVWLPFQQNIEYPICYIKKAASGGFYFCAMHSIYKLNNNSDLSLIYHSRTKEWRATLYPIVNLENEFIGFRNDINDSFFSINNVKKEYKQFPSDAISWYFFEKNYHNFMIDVMPTIDVMSRGKFSTFTSKDGTIWVTSNTGLFKLNKKEKLFSFYEVLFRHSTRGMFEDSESKDIYISSYKGLKILHSNQRFSSPNFNELPYKILFKKKDRLLVMTENSGPSWWNLKDNKTHSIVTSNKSSFTLSTGTFINKDSILYFGYLGNIYEYDIINEKLLSSHFDLKNHLDSINGEIYNIYGTLRGDFWISSNNGVFCFNKNFEIKTYNFSNSDLLGRNTFIVDSYESKNGALWMASKKFGLIHIDFDKNKIEKFGLNEGLASDEAYSVLSNDGGKTFWVSTANGLSCFDTQNNEIRNYYDFDGLANNEFNRTSFLAASNGNFYFGGVNGVSYFNPIKIPSKKANFKPLITQYLIYSTDGTIKNFENLGKINNLITLDSKDNIIEFQVSSSDYHDISKRAYQYLLEGFDHNWVNLGKNNDRIRYMNLPAGDYTLKLRAFGGQGVWSKEELKVSIKVKQVFYKTIWFFILVGLTISVFFYGLFQYRLYQIRQYNNIRLSIGTNIHDELGGTLYAINHTAHVIKNDTVTDESKLDKLVMLCQKAYKSMGELIWAINPDNQYIEKLLEKMDDEKYDILGEYTKLTNIEVKDLNINKKISIELSHNILMIYKEALTNIVKHTIPTKINITIKNKPFFMMEITNFYTNTKETELSTGNGIKNMQKRASLINSNLEIRKLENSQTLILKLENSI